MIVIALGSGESLLGPLMEASLSAKETSYLFQHGLVQKAQIS